jgi:hypothetical protein
MTQLELRTYYHKTRGHIPKIELTDGSTAVLSGILEAPDDD